MGCRLPDDIQTFGVSRGVRLIAVVGFSGYNGIEVEVTAAGGDGWLSRRVYRALSDYAFQSLGARRVTAVTDSSNVPARHVLERLGFAREGTLRRAANDGGDRELYSLLVEDHVEQQAP